MHPSGQKWDLFVEASPSFVWHHPCVINSRKPVWFEAEAEYNLMKGT